MDIISNTEEVENELTQPLKLKSSVRQLIKDRDKSFIRYCKNKDINYDQYEKKKRNQPICPDEKKLLLSRKESSTN